MDTLGDILDDAKVVFEFRDDARPQDRAHEYLTRHRVLRGFNDTAMQCAVEDMIHRAVKVGMDEAANQDNSTRDLLYRMGGELIAAANKIGEVHS